MEERSEPNSGFTLVELVVVITISSILAVLIGFPLIELTKSYHRTTQRSELLRHGQVAMQRVSSELRSLSSNGDGDPDVTSADADALSFGTVSYRLNGSTLERSDSSATGSWQTLCTNVSSWTLTYYDEGASSLSTPLSAGDLDAVRRIKIEIAFSGGAETLTVIGGAHFRNWAYENRAEGI